MQPLNTAQMMITDARHMPIIKAYLCWVTRCFWSLHHGQEAVMGKEIGSIKIHRSMG